MDLMNKYVEAEATPAEPFPATARVIKSRQRRLDEFQADEGYGSYPSSVQDDREVNYKIENAQAPVAWDEQTQKLLSTKHYRRVAVLMMSFDEPVDNLDAKDELDNLQHVFREIYSFHVTRVLLRQRKQRLDQIQIIKELASFVIQQDDKNSLLIVYYAGHAIPGDGPGQLQLAGRGSPGRYSGDGLHMDVWNCAEATLPDASADVLEIFDCCAGNPGITNGGWSPRCSEYLAATTAGHSSIRPGKESFTSALIWALTELAVNGRGFTTSQLARKIKQAPNFPHRQFPILMERAGSLDRIVLTPLAKDTGNSNPEQLVAYNKKDFETMPFDYLDLRCVLTRHLSIREVKDFAQCFNTFCKHNGSLPLSHVVWSGLPSSQVSSITDYELFAESRHKTGIPPRTYRLELEAAMEFKQLGDRNRADEEKTQGKSVEVLRAAKIVEQDHRRLGAEHKSLYRSIVFRSFVTLLLYLFSQYCSGSPLLYIGVFYVLFLVLLITIDLVEVSCAQFTAAYVWQPCVNAFRYVLRPAVPLGHIRVAWKCHCGKSSYDDFVEYRPGTAMQLMMNLEIHTRPNPVLPTFEPRQNGTSTALSLRSVLSRFAGNNRQLHHEQDNNLAQMPEIWMGPDSDIPPRSSSDRNGYVLACINGFHTQPEMFHLHWKPGLNDRTMFLQMQRQYHHVRGKWKRWLSLWSLHSVLFIQFEAFPHQLINVRKEHDLPPEDPHHRKIYAFTPRPTDICPPLGPNFLKHRVQHPDHAGEITRCCEQFPKKLLGNVATGDVAWGLQFNEGLDRARLSVVVVSVFISSTLVGCVFAKVRGDVQSGFAIASYIMAALAVGVCSVQLTVEQLTKS